jgi:hypothetical protein
VLCVTINDCFIFFKYLLGNIGFQLESGLKLMPSLISINGFNASSPLSFFNILNALGLILKYEYANRRFPRIIEIPFKIVLLGIVGRKNRGLKIS